MDEQEKLSALLRLKRYELPGDDFAETFLASFHRYQRARQERRNAVVEVWERIVNGLEALRRPWVSWAAAGAYGLAVLAVAAWPQPDRSGPRTAALSLDHAPLAALSLAAKGLPPAEVEVDEEGLLPVGFRPDTPESIPGRTALLAAGDRTLHRLNSPRGIRYSPE